MRARAHKSSCRRHGVIDTKPRKASSPASLDFSGCRAYTRGIPAERQRCAPAIGSTGHAPGCLLRHGTGCMYSTSTQPEWTGAGRRKPRSPAVVMQTGRTQRLVTSSAKDTVLCTVFQYLHDVITQFGPRPGLGQAAVTGRCRLWDGGRDFESERSHALSLVSSHILQRSLQVVIGCFPPQTSR